MCFLMVILQAASMLSLHCKSQYSFEYVLWLDCITVRNRREASTSVVDSLVVNRLKAEMTHL